MEVRIENFEPIEVVYTFASGPYSASPGKAWAALCHWIEEKKLQSNITRMIGYGMDNPFSTPPPLIRYVAAFALSDGLQSDEEANIHIMTIPGGTYAVHKMLGAYGQMPERFRQLQEEWLRSSGRKIDFMRPFLEVYLNKMGEVPEAEQETDICLPLCGDP